MLDDHADGSATPESHDSAPAPVAAKKTTRKRTTKKAASADTAAGTPAEQHAAAESGDAGEPAKKTTARKRAAKKTTSAATAADTPAEQPPAAEGGDADKPAKKTTARKRTTKKTAPAAETPSEASDTSRSDSRPSMAAVFQPPDAVDGGDGTAGRAGGGDAAAGGDPAAGDQDEGDASARRRRRRGGRRRRKSGAGEGEGHADSAEQDDTEGEPQDKQDKAASGSEPAEGGESTSSRRRRRRRRSGEDDGDASDDPSNTVTRVRSGRSAADEITAVTGSTRLEAKKQRRREGREAGRRRAPIVSEAEFLARRESVNRVMVVRQREDVTQIGVLEDNVLVEHYVARESQTSLIGNVYLGRVQNVLPSMEAAFIDIGKGRNAVLYAGEVNWSALGHKDGQPRKIESVLTSGQTVLVQVTKDPIGHKGARLTSQISLAGRFLVYVPDGTTSGISRKLPDTERNRLKTLLKDIVPEQAGVIVRTAAEGASEDELTRDVERLTARWDDIEKKAKGSAPQLLYGEPDLTLKVVRDLFTEDFAKLVIEGDEAWETVQGYVAHVAPDLEDRLERYERKKDQDAFAAYRIEEQIKKGLERKVWLPSGGSLIIDRTEAMTVIDVNTGKFTGSGGNLEETVTKNNLEAAEEIVRQLRLRDIGGIIVVDFIDMVLESNRDLVLRRLVECLGRDRTRHQVAEVTSLGLVQMTRKRIGTGLLESFSHDCPTCHGRGVVIEEAPVEPRKSDEEPRRARRSRSRGKGQDTPAESPKTPSPKDIAAMARHHEEHPDDETDETDETDEMGTAGDEELEVVDHEQEEDTSPALDEAEVETDAVDDVDDEPDSAPESPQSTESSESPDSSEVPEAPTEPAPPRVVTRTRRRSASRPAGPPAASGDAAGSASDSTEHLTDESPALHVPVKRKGARKR